MSPFGGRPVEGGGRPLVYFASGMVSIVGMQDLVFGLPAPFLIAYGGRPGRYIVTFTYVLN
jgi:hypothetical protein